MDLSIYLQEILSGFAPLITLLMLIIYTVECFFGYKVIRSWISILGFILGAFIGYHLVSIFTASTGILLLGTILCGILLSILAYRVYLVGLFAIGAISVFQISTTLLPEILPVTLSVTVLYALAIVLGIGAGYLAVKFMRPAIIGITAFHGGIMAAGLLPALVDVSSMGIAPYLGIALGIAGLIIQFFTTK